VLDLVEDPFDQVAGAIEMRAEADRLAAIDRGGILASATFFAATALISLRGEIDTRIDRAA
jgi:hypothetical protein